MNMGQLSSRDIDDVVDEIAQIKAENIYIADDDFLYDTDRLNRFVKEVRRRRIHKKIHLLWKGGLYCPQSRHDEKAQGYRVILCSCGA